ncbi:winged helix-turn-helix transcriptional regulator [Streptomyces sp. TRM66268-LWL]|uniref:Winged helix-turn-helix transcriptional regulator n=1 Tax=Streptomyces polyasparticus TaxID=2767826 RepID=A0ABR7SMS8_9ACTN|nr:winged helix-turn-helix domain-containing protein [Streptomyces polyasparticus]MBC9716154.1 winged helix-turn-helix transcriptional regulator [Streptomyces polyasparticus]
MLRIHFTAADLTRVRIADRAHLLWETVLSLHRLRDRWAPGELDGWRAGARHRLGGDPERGRRALGVMGALIPERGNFPDFLTPSALHGSIDESLDVLASTPRKQLGLEMGRLDAVPTWLQPLADGDRHTLGLLTGSLRDYHRASIAPYLDRVHAQVDAERAVALRGLLDGGTEGMLARLRPVLRWKPPVLEADYPMPHDIHLAGRGLVLVPSYFCARRPVTLVDEDLPPVLVYPVRRTGAGTGRPAGGRGPLDRLLGRTRSAVLASVDGGCTTGELARRVGVSPASASQHASVLREAGLVSTVRDGPSVLHTLTPLGRRLLSR